MIQQKLILFEGADKSGKSTIAQALSKELNIPIFKVQRNKYWWDPAINLLYLTEGITQFIEQTGVSVILDRWIGSDYMYSKLFDREISYNKIFDIDFRLSKLNTLLIICYKQPYAFIHDIEDEQFINEKQYEKMTALYREYERESLIDNVLFLDTSDENLEEQLNKIIAKIK
jgi:thymidylate kinase